MAPSIDPHPSSADPRTLPTLADLETAGAGYATGWWIDDPAARGALAWGRALLRALIEDALEVVAHTAPARTTLGPLLPQTFDHDYDERFLRRFLLRWDTLEPTLLDPEPPSPSCLAQELQLAIAIRLAHDLLSTIGAPERAAGLDGVFEVCQDDDVLLLYAMDDFHGEETAEWEADGRQGDAPVPGIVDGWDWRPARWFDDLYSAPFDDPGDPVLGAAGHPLPPHDAP